MASVADLYISARAHREQEHNLRRQYGETDANVSAAYVVKWNSDLIRKHYFLRVIPREGSADGMHCETLTQTQYQLRLLAVAAVPNWQRTQ